MRRGRWVAYCGVLFFFFCFAASSSFAQPLGMSASVPLSPLWKEALLNNSTAQIDTTHAHIALITQRSLGIGNLPVSQETIQLLVLRGGTLLSHQEKMTDRTGVAQFVFVSDPGTYTIIVVNKTEIPFVVKNVTISL